MKYAVVFSALVAAAAAAAAAANPSFLNSDFDVKEGVGFNLKFNNCQGGCTIILQNGPSTNTRDVKTLTTTATGDSFTFTAKDITTGVYNFKIVSNADAKAFNYSKQFSYTGTGTIGASKSGTSSSDHPTSTASSTASSALPTASRTNTATASTTMASATGSSSKSSASSPSNTSGKNSRLSFEMRRWQPIWYT
ncbi:hypothetical protein E4U53_003837 [Claviceps sorghi]|nr:hypothetical protein E4U53_003837 [Claviceps sorghi]